jgi:sulfoacetaldehyde dehydrogenase
LNDVETLVARARSTQQIFAQAEQPLIDMAVAAAAWAILEPGRNRALAEQAVAETGLGNVADKVAKNHRKTLGLLRDLHGAKSAGVIHEDLALGLTEIARPVGVVAAITPSTNPAATPVNNVINALKGRNAIVLAPSPKGAGTCARLLDYIHAELAKIGLPVDLVQMLPAPASKQQTAELMRVADLVVATGSRANVRAAYASGTPALGVGAGNVAAIVKPAADMALAAARIAASKTFDNATSCSSENSLVIVGEAWRPLIAALTNEGGVLLAEKVASRLQSAMFPDGHLAPEAVGRDALSLIRLAGFKPDSFAGARFLMVEQQPSQIGPEHPFSGEKLSPVLTLYRASDFTHAIALVRALYEHQGKGHSVGIHGGGPEDWLRLGEELPVCRVIVDQVHSAATGGAFDNGLPFSLSMGCGTWGGNGFSDNLNYRHFLNITQIVRPIPPRMPEVEDVLGAYWSAYGR